MCTRLGLGFKLLAKREFPVPTPRTNLLLKPWLCHMMRNVGQLYPYRKNLISNYFLIVMIYVMCITSIIFLLFLCYYYYLLLLIILFRFKLLGNKLLLLLLALNSSALTQQLLRP